MRFLASNDLARLCLDQTATFAIVSYEYADRTNNMSKVESPNSHSSAENKCSLESPSNRIVRELATTESPLATMQNISNFHVCIHV